MNRLVRIWLILAVAYASGKAVVELTLYGVVSTWIAGWIAVPFIAALQMLALVAVTRRRADSGEPS